MADGTVPLRLALALVHVVGAATDERLIGFDAAEERALQGSPACRHERCIRPMLSRNEPDCAVLLIRDLYSYGDEAVN